MLFGGAGFLVKWVADHLVPPRGVFDWLLVILAASIAVLVAATWLSLLRVLKVRLMIVTLSLVLLVSLLYAVHAWTG